jgi:hypothetical protein
VNRFLHNRSCRKALGPTTKAQRQNKLILTLPDLLLQALNSVMDDSALTSYLKKLQTEFTIRMNLDAEDGTMQNYGMNRLRLNYQPWKSQVMKRFNNGRESVMRQNEG